jgi:hypothetical protein
MVPVDTQFNGQKLKFGAGPEFFYAVIYFYLFKSHKSLE